jgi:hypothetical protein
MKALAKKKQQSGFVILGIVKFSIKIIFPMILNDEGLLNKYLDNIKLIFSDSKFPKSEGFEIFKSNLTKSIETKHWDDVQHLILNYESDDISNDKKSSRKSLSIGETADFNTESSTKLDNKLEISVKDAVSSTRNLHIISPVNRIVKSESSANIKMLHNDHIKFTNASKVKYPFISLAVDITLTAVQIKRLFIAEMNK